MDDAKLNDITLQCEIIGDTFPKSIAEYKFPYRNDTLLDDMGQDTRIVRLRCYFWDSTYELHKSLLSLLYTETSFELYHPAYGLLKGSVKNIVVRHDDRDQTAEIDIDFVEGVTELAVVKYEDIEQKAEKVYEEGLEDAQEGIIESAKAAIGSEAQAILEKVLDPAQGVLEQFTGISKTARAYVKKVDRVVGNVEATLNSIATPANALISTLSFAANLPGRVMGAVAHVADRYSRLYDSLKNAPDRFIQSYKDGVTALENSLWTTDDTDDVNVSLKATYKSATALEGGLQAGYAFSDDEENRRVLKRVESESRFDALGNYILPPSINPVMNVREIEAMLYTARQMLQTAIDMNRKNQSLKDMAKSLLYHVNVIKLEIEKIVRVDIDEMPLHLVCLKYGLPYQAADRILAINDMKNPNFVSGSIDIYAR